MFNCRLTTYSAYCLWQLTFWQSKQQHIMQWLSFSALIISTLQQFFSLPSPKWTWPITRHIPHFTLSIWKHLFIKIQELRVGKAASNVRGPLQRKWTCRKCWKVLEEEKKSLLWSFSSIHYFMTCTVRVNLPLPVRHPATISRVHIGSLMWSVLWAVTKVMIQLFALSAWTISVMN